MTSEVIGTWFPSGYHGHYRNRTRTDVLNEYRQKAKPAPPETFHRRFRDIRLKNPFTSHDNKSSLILDAMGFGQGVGKRKVETKCGNKYQPDFFSWQQTGNRVSNYKSQQQQQKHLEDDNFDDSFVSVNQSSYTGGSPVPSRKVLLSAHDDAAANQLNSTYRLTYGVPVQNRMMRRITPSATSQEPVQEFTLPPMTAKPGHRSNHGQQMDDQKLRLRTKSAPPRSLTVQDCLIWHDMIKPPKVEAAETVSSNCGNSREPCEVETTVTPLNFGTQIEAS